MDIEYIKQLSFDDIFSEQYKIYKPIRLIELFGGIGSQAKALERLGADFEHYRLVEFDPAPVSSYNAIHGTNFEPTDITKINANDLGIEDREHFTYLLTHFHVRIFQWQVNEKVSVREVVQEVAYFGKSNDYLTNVATTYHRYYLWRM